MSSSETLTSDEKPLTTSDEQLVSMPTNPTTITPSTLFAHGAKTTIFKLENTDEFDADPQLKREEPSSFDDRIHISMIASLEEEILGTRSDQQQQAKLKRPRAKLTGAREKRPRRPKQLLVAGQNSSEDREMDELFEGGQEVTKKGRRPKRMRKNSDKPPDDSLLDSSCSRDQHFSSMHHELMKDGGSSLDMLNHSQCSNSSSNDAYGSSKSNEGSSKQHLFHFSRSSSWSLGWSRLVKAQLLDRSSRPLKCLIFYF